jgi:hypothetical protein
MKASDFDLQLEQLYEDSVGRLLNDHFDASKFEAFRQYLCQKAELIKAEHVVSKQVIHYLLSAQGAIESRAEYLPVVRNNIQLAHTFAYLLNLIAIGEGCNDRKAGVPRII